MFDRSSLLAEDAFRCFCPAGAAANPFMLSSSQCLLELITLDPTYRTCAPPPLPPPCSVSLSHYLLKLVNLDPAMINCTQPGRPNLTDHAPLPHPLHAVPLPAPKCFHDHITAKSDKSRPNYQRLPCPFPFPHAVPLTEALLAEDAFCCLPCWCRCQPLSCFLDLTMC